MRELPKLRGAGDLLEAVTTATGIKAATEAVSKATGKDCGCSKRRDKLNKLIPFGRNDDGVQHDPPRAE